MSSSARVRISGKERRRVIQRAAEELFAAHGYGGASMDAIAARAGISAPVLYDHFPSKAALHRELLRDAGPALFKAVTDRIAAERTLKTRLAAGTDAFFEFVHEHPATWRLMFRDPPSDPQVAEQARRQQAQTTLAIAQLLQREPGVAASGDPSSEQSTQMIAEFLKTGLNGLAGWWWDHPQVPRERLVEIVMATVWTGLERLYRDS